MIRPADGDDFVQDLWEERYGLSPAAWPEPGQAALGLRCDSDGCILERHGRRLLIAMTDAALAEDCTSADATVALTAAHAFCDGPAVVDQIDVRRRGAAAVWLSGSKIRTRYVADALGNRPWARAVKPAAARSDLTRSRKTPGDGKTQ
jgi:hypothetical protein